MIFDEACAQVLQHQFIKELNVYFEVVSKKITKKGVAKC